MKIKTIEPIAVSLPMLKPVIMAGEEVRRADNVLVRIETDSGVVGWGEAASAPVAAALANAIFDATGVRLRTVPFTPERLKAALA